jgi:hypothetical protein
VCREPVEDLVRAECGCAFCRCVSRCLPYVWACITVTRTASHDCSKACWSGPSGSLVLRCSALLSSSPRLCVREFVETQVLESSSLSCPRCSAQLTVDLNASSSTSSPKTGSAHANNPRRSNKAGTVCVAGKVKVRAGWLAGWLACLLACLAKPPRDTRVNHCQADGVV